MHKDVQALQTLIDANHFTADNNRFGLAEKAQDALIRIEAILPQWKSIESAPKDGTCILLFSDKDDTGAFNDYSQGIIVAFWHIRKDFWCAADGSVSIDTPTHWMFLPPMPELFVGVK